MGGIAITNKVKCPVCRSYQNTVLLDRESVPVFVNRLPVSEEAARAFPTGRLRLLECLKCRFVWNCMYDSEKVRFDSQYENELTHSKTYRDHMIHIRDLVWSKVPNHLQLDILEIGCGQGVFLLNLLDSSHSERIRSLVGFDPAYRGRSPIPTDRINIYAEYFTSKAASKLKAEPNLILMRHVLGYIMEPVEFLSSITSHIGNGVVTVLVESPNVQWLLERGEMQNILYETCSFFSPQSLRVAFEESGFTLESSEPIFGEQYFFATARYSRDDLDSNSKPVSKLEEKQIKFIKHWRNFLEGAKDRGAVAVWGAAAKGVSFAQMVDPTTTLISCLVDINPGKQGHFVPLTAHPVLSADEAMRRPLKTIIVANPIYRDEIEAYVRKSGSNAQVVALSGLSSLGKGNG
jgi:hypothetical protein